MNIEYRIDEKRMEESLQSQFSAPTERNLTAQGNALCNDAPTNSIAPRSAIVQGDEFIWGNKENVEYRITNKECKSLKIEAPTGRNLIAQGDAVCNDVPTINALKGHNISARGNALGLNAPTTPIAPRSAIVQGDKFAWGKTNNENKENVEYRITNNECRSWKIEAPTERNLTAQGAALCNLKRNPRCAGLSTIITII